MIGAAIAQPPFQVFVAPASVLARSACATASRPLGLCVLKPIFSRCSSVLFRPASKSSRSCGSMPILWARSATSPTALLLCIVVLLLYRPSVQRALARQGHLPRRRAGRQTGCRFVEAMFRSTGCQSGRGGYRAGVAAAPVDQERNTPAAAPSWRPTGGVPLCALCCARPLLATSQMAQGGGPWTSPIPVLGVLFELLGLRLSGLVPCRLAGASLFVRLSWRLVAPPVPGPAFPVPPVLVTGRIGSLALVARSLRVARCLVFELAVGALDLLEHPFGGRIALVHVGGGTASRARGTAI